MERKCEMVQEKCMVNVWKSVPKTVTCKETFWKCVPVCKTETYTCIKHVCVPYEACRTVNKCVPCTEEVTCCRMVSRCVAKQVPVCEQSCCGSTCCEESCCKARFGDRMRGWFANRHNGCGCESGCGFSGGCGGCGH
jgi:hypothetical protein